MSNQLLKCQQVDVCEIQACLSGRRLTSVGCVLKDGKRNREIEASLRSAAGGGGGGGLPFSHLAGIFTALLSNVRRGRVDSVRRLQHVEEKLRGSAEGVAQEVTEPSACECPPSSQHHFASAQVLLEVSLDSGPTGRSKLTSNDLNLLQNSI